MKLLFSILLLINAIFCFGQDAEILVSGSYERVPFVEFADALKKSEDLRFYFREEWVNDVFISATGFDMKLSGILNANFPKGLLSFTIEGKDVFIYPGKPVLDRLPSYIRDEVVEIKGPLKDEKITDSELKYLEGRVVAEVKILSIGNRQQFVEGMKCIVSGKIDDKESGEPLIGATIYVEELKTGSATDLDGRFKLVIPTGNYLATINCMGMKKQEIDLHVYSNGRVTIEMEKELINIQEVTVSASRYDNVAGIQMGFERISTKSMKEIPVVMGEKDVIKVAQLLPGIQSVGEGSSGFNVRGSSTDQNMFYLNKIPIYNTSHLFGFFTAFSPDIINDFSLYKSNIPAKYGGRLASIFDISTRQGNKKKFYGQGGISPVTGHIELEGPLVKDKVSFVTSLRSTYSNWILKRINNFDIQNSNAFFYDASLGINAEVNEKNLVKVFAYRSSDRFSLADKNDFSYSNTGAAINWKHLYSSAMTADFSLVYSRYIFDNSDKADVSAAYNHSYRIDHTELKADFLYLTLSNHRIEFGGSGIFYNLNRGNITPFGEESIRIPYDLGVENGIEGAIYLSDEFQLFSRLTLSGGLRYSFYGALGPQEVNEYFPGAPKNINNIKEIKSFGAGQFVKAYSGPEYRAAVNYRLTNSSSVKASANRHRQYIFILSNTIALSPNDQWKLADYNIVPPVSDQVSLGYYQDFPGKGIVASVEVYRKWIHNVVEYQDGVDFISPDPVEMQILQGDLNTKGVEFLLKKNGGKLTGWVSYTYSRSLITIDGDQGETQINKGKEYPSNYDIPHSFNFISNYRLNRRLSFSANVVYSTGRPVTYPTSVYFSGGHEFLYFSERNRYRIPDYFRVDLSINLEGNLRFKKLAHSFWMLNIYNLTGRKNAYSIFFDSESGAIKGNRLSIFAQPIVTLSWNFKFGNYLNE